MLDRGGDYEHDDGLVTVVVSAENSSHTFGIKDLLLSGILFVDAVELEAVFFGKVLGIGDLDDGGFSLRPSMAGHNLIIGVFGFEERSDTGNDADAHPDRVKQIIICRLLRRLGS